MPRAERSYGKKADYFVKLQALLDEYPKILVVGVDNVRSHQMQQIRQSLRGKAVLLMGKNTMIRKVLRAHTEKNPNVQKLVSHIVYNVGFVFTKGDLKEIRDLVVANKVAAPAKAGSIAPVDVVIPATNTGLGPEKTSFFQALNIPTKISRGTIEIISDVHLITAGDKVGASEATLLGMLKVMPFAHGLQVRMIYDNGEIFEPAVLDITTEQLLQTFRDGVRNVAAVSLAIGVPTLASVPHSLINGYKRVLAAVLTMDDYSFKLADRVKEMLKNPGAFAAVAASATPVVAAAAAAAAAPAAEAAKGAKEAKKAAPEPEEEEDLGLGLFD